MRSTPLWRPTSARTGATLLDAEAEPLASLVLAHRLAISLAHLRGLDPDNPRNLTRSVVLQ